MKKYLMLIFTFGFFLNQTFAEFIDDSISKELEKNIGKTESLVLDFEMKSYDSCEKIDEVLGKYIENEKIKFNKRRERFINLGLIKTVSKTSGVVNDFGILENTSPTANSSRQSDDTSRLSSEEFSGTNVQISGIDESEIIKTDGKFIYYLSEKQNRDRFIQIFSLEDKKIVKKIKIPEKLSSVEFYLSDGKLILLGDLFLENIFTSRNFYYPASQSYAIVYNISDLENLKLERFFIIDGSYRNSRLIGDKLYIISNNNFYFDLNSSEKFLFRKSIPAQSEVVLKNGKYSFSKKFASDCQNIEFILPDEKYFEENDFDLNYSIISVLDIKNVEKNILSKVIVSSDNSEIFMNEKNLYLTSYIYSYKPLKCEGKSCLFNAYEGLEQTLVNKFSLENNNIKYKKSVLIDGQPLTKYSMDEDEKGNFRILTQINSWSEKSGNFVNFYILDSDLKFVSKLEKLGVGEQFKSSRYIGNKLFLVTFERTDPLFVIDLENEKNPKILGELKIPGYSVYLHPYDEKHLIGLGYDTKENSWGGIQNSGLKIDLYQINYDKKCGDFDLSNEEEEKCSLGEYKGIIAKQLFTKTLGGNGSYSEALNNPKMFIWNSLKNKLFLPVSLRDYDDEKSDFFAGTSVISIDKDKGIIEDFRVTNIEKEEIEKQFLDFCKGEKKYYSCESLEKFFGNYSYKFSDSIINRTLWIGENFYSLSPNKIKINNIDSGKELLNIDL